ncbi:hypothetical protein Rhe02_83840 [Rhizocola hellebori]|uniref:Uncharacterized protein n=2 Tax=Rhizocola hellebori TaxID=1392758 RepID=A0A8J3VL71_9ACTN|nr:hypothetical protein Rhe02_83840 [Rhizocola hellebori]
MTGLVTDVDCAVWQRKAAAALAEMLAEVVTHQLAPVLWQVSILGTLAGRCADRDMAARRSTFTQWMQFLQVAGWREWEHDGVIHLYGITSGFRGCQVSLTADLYDNESGDQP